MAEPCNTDERKAVTETACDDASRYGDGDLRLALKLMRRKAAYNLRTARNLKVNVPQYPELERERMHFEKLYSAAAAAIEETLKQRAHLAGGTTPTPRHPHNE